MNNRDIGRDIRNIRKRIGYKTKDPKFTEDDCYRFCCMARR